MSTLARRHFCCLALVILPVGALNATSIPRLTFEQLIDGSDVIASGRVTQSWAAWDSEHKYIWTHYVLSVKGMARGTSASSVEFAEPGGTIGGASLSIAGTVTYQIGDNVVIFLWKMPNGYLRTAGWAQGKYQLDADGHLHSWAAIGGEIDEGTHAQGSSLKTLEGMSVAELYRRIADRLRTTSGRAK